MHSVATRHYMKQHGMDTATRYSCLLRVGLMFICSTRLDLRLLLVNIIFTHALKLSCIQLNLPHVQKVKNDEKERK